MILIASLYIKDKIYYSQVILEKYISREKKISNFTTGNIEICSDDSGEKTQMKNEICKFIFRSNKNNMINLCF